jgi:hypothetical protein
VRCHTAQKNPPDQGRVFGSADKFVRERLEALALQALALHLARSPHGLGRFPRSALRRLLEMATQLHLAEDPFPLHLLFERLERLIDIVITNENLHLAACSISLDYEKGGRAPDDAYPRSGRRYNMIACPLQPLSASPFWEPPLAILKIARMGHPVLLEHAAPVPDPSHPEIQRLIEDMIETMLDAGGIGLAAPQVHVPLRLFVFHLPAAKGG